MTLTLPEHVRAAMLQRLTGGPRQWTLREVCETTDHRTRWTRALQLIDDAVTRCINTPDGRLILAMPPQEGKSTTVSINLPIKVLIDDPETRIITGSYAQSLANRNGRSVRNHIKSYPELGLAIAQDNGAAAEWTLEGHRGGLLELRGLRTLAAWQPLPRREPAASPRTAEPSRVLLFQCRTGAG